MSEDRDRITGQILDLALRHCVGEQEKPYESDEEYERRRNRAKHELRKLITPNNNPYMRPTPEQALVYALFHRYVDWELASKTQRLDWLPPQEEE